MENKGKQLAIFIPYKDKSTRKFGEDCIANGKELFDAVKKSFENKKEVRLGKHLITSVILIYDNGLEALKIEDQSIVVVHAFGGEVNGNLRDDNQGKMPIKEAVALLETLVGETKVIEYHFAICYSALNGHIAKLWKEKYPEAIVFGTQIEYDEASLLYVENETQLKVAASTTKRMT